MYNNPTLLNALNSPVRNVRARVRIYNNIDNSNRSIYSDDKINELTIERVGIEGKFFGYGICQKLTLKTRNFTISTANDRLKVFFGAGATTATSMGTPFFKITRITKSENEKELTITAYDALYSASEHTVSELGLSAPYTIREFATACATLLNLPIIIDLEASAAFDVSYPTGANFEGTETIRAALDAIAEATQTIYFINDNSNQDSLWFRRLDKDGAAIFTIDNEKYFKLDSSENKRLATICHATELGDNISASTAANGSTQYIRDNPFWELREDIATLVDNALAIAGGFTISQFECEWRGNFLLEIGDKIALTTKDNTTITAYLLDDVINFNGTLSEKTRWKYTDDGAETESNSTSLGETLKQTYAKVDKVNKQIELVASEASENTEKIASILVDTASITSSIKSIGENTDKALESIDGSIETLTKEVAAKMTADDVKIEISKELSNGVDKVITKTGYTFDDSGLTVEKTDSEMKTTISDDGMKVYRNEEAVLTANNVGVSATNLHATTYIIIGENSRLETYGNNRSGCFWIGG